MVGHRLAVFGQHSVDQRGDAAIAVGRTFIDQAADQGRNSSSAALR